MNRQLRHVAIAVLLMFAALLINSNVVQVGQASSLRADPHNVRVLYGEYSHQRGPIVVGGNSIARSVKTHDRLKYLRVYPGGPEYAPVTGYYSLVFSSAGIEQAENSTLAGTTDKLFFHRISDEITGRTPQGGSVDLTINPEAQHAAYQGLASAPSFNGVSAGAVVALNPQTGAILALASYPSYDPATISGHDTKSDQAAWDQLTKHTPGDPLLNRALNQSYPPGSTFKVITSATALSSGKYTPTQPLIPAPSKLTFRNTTHTLSNFQGESCPGAGQITLAEALKISCNTAFGSLGLKLGTNAIAKQADAFGFGKGVDIPLGVSSSQYVKTDDPPLLADSAIGQYSDSVTPLQMAMVAAGIANHGVVMKPYLVADTKGPDASVLSRAHPQPFSQAVSSQVASQLTTMMEAVVQGGTGTAAQISGVPVAAKTGTAENVPGQPTHAWFIAFAPATHPTIAVAVLVEHGGVGGVAAAPIARSVMCAVLSGC